MTRRSPPLRTVELQLTPGEWGVIHELAGLRGITMSDLLREAIRLPTLTEALDDISEANAGQNLEVVALPEQNRGT